VDSVPKEQTDAGADSGADVVAGLIGLGWSRADALRSLDRARGRVLARGGVPEGHELTVLGPVPAAPSEDWFAG
jgi:hypothetical protein